MNRTDLYIDHAYELDKGRLRKKLEILALIQARMEPADTVLDLGCGIGFYLLRLGSLYRAATAVDFTQKPLDMFRQAMTPAIRKKVVLIRQDIRTIELVSQVNCIFLLDTLEHLKHGEGAALLGRVYDWLEPAGQLFIYTPCHPCYLKQDSHLYIWLPQKLKKQLTELGFKELFEMRLHKGKIFMETRK